MDAYALLGVTPHCTDATIKKAWRAKARACHPDCTTGNTADMAAINAAYDQICTAAKRAAYHHNADFDTDLASCAEDILRAFDSLFADIFGTPLASPLGRGADRHLCASVHQHTTHAPQTLQVDDTDGRSWRVHIPMGVTHGQVFRLKSQGHTGISAPGDALITIHIAP